MPQVRGLIQVNPDAAARTEDSGVARRGLSARAQRKKRMGMMATTFAALDASDADTRCFHCGAPANAGLHAVIDGVERDMCCAGCQAVAVAIAGAGLSTYYTRRTQPAQVADTSSATQAEFAALDALAYQRSVVRVRDDGSREVSLALGGIACPACNWLIEQRLQALDGVQEAVVDYGARRAYVRWDEASITLSRIVAAVRAIGYGAEPFDPERAAAGRRSEARSSLWRLFVAGFGMMQVMMYAVPVYLSGGDMTADVEALMRWASLVLTLPVVAFAAQPFYSGALRDLRARTTGMDVPVALGIVIAFFASVYATVAGRGSVYFDSVAMFVFLLLGARHLELIARSHAGDALDRMQRLLPAFAFKLGSSSKDETAQRVAVAELVPADRVLVAAGEVVPADGTVESGVSDVDESLITGESRGVMKRPGMRLIGGSINRASRLVMRVEQVGTQTTVAAIGRMLDRAGADKPRLALLAERLAARFTVAILLIAAAAGLVWWFIDPERALPIAVTVLVITCPCALALATPAALAAATGSLLRLGVLVTRGHALETLARATHFVFDKTGTMTTGRPAVTGILPLGERDAQASLALAAALETGSTHPLARALVQAAAGAGSRPAPTSIRDVAGLGVEARVEGRLTRIGRPEFVAEITGSPAPQALAFMADAVQVVALGDERGWIALFALSDAVRGQARALVRGLEADGRSVCLLTGDRAAVARHVAGELGISQVVADARPEDKLEHVRRLQSHGAIVAMIGDGVNDAPVLAQAQISVAMGSGADIARCSADIILATDRLDRLRDAIEVARRTERVIAQNLAWAMLYNVIAVPAAVLGVVDPLIASIGMAASSALVVANALRAAHPALWRGARTQHAAVANATAFAPASAKAM